MPDEGIEPSAQPPDKLYGHVFYRHTSGTSGLNGLYETRTRANSLTSYRAGHYTNRPKYDRYGTGKSVLRCDPYTILLLLGEEGIEPPLTA